jgi:hypothetical protein
VRHVGAHLDVHVDEATLRHGHAGFLGGDLLAVTAGELCVPAVITDTFLEFDCMNMKRREFSQVAAGAALASAALLSPLAHAQAKKPVAGKDFHILDAKAPVEAPTGRPHQHPRSQHQNFAWAAVYNFNDDGARYRGAA